MWHQFTRPWLLGLSHNRDMSLSYHHHFILSKLHQKGYPLGSLYFYMMICLSICVLLLFRSSVADAWRLFFLLNRQ